MNVFLRLVAALAGVAAGVGFFIIACQGHWAPSAPVGVVFLVIGFWYASSITWRK